MIDFVYSALATATLVTDALIFTLIVLYLLQRNGKEKLPLFTFFQKNSVNLVFASTFIATLGSLFFSEVAKFAPCILCWYQRIFTYPQALIAYISIMRSESRFVAPYLLALNIVGILFSMYHNFILWFPEYAEFISCSTKGGPSCIEGYTFYYGYITIPMMALTVFLFNIVMLTLYREEPAKKVKKMN